MMRSSLTPLLGALGLMVSSVALGQAAPAQLDAAANRALGLRASTVQTLDILVEDDASLQVPMMFEGGWTQLSLQPHSVRAAGFELVAQNADGSYTSVDPGRTVTLRGSLEGHVGSRVAGAVLEDGFYGRIILGDDTEFWIQPMAGLVPDATTEDYVLYRRDDVLPTGYTCGSSLIANNFGDLGASVSAPMAGAGSSLYTCQLACDADFEYYLDYGGSTTNVSNRIQTVIATMNLQYESEVDITHEITQILVRTSSNQPYTSTSAGNLLDQFVNQWNANHGGITRDIAQLFTGKSIQGGTIGIAYVGVICNGSFGYGLVESDFNGNFASATDLSAHELGHNWNAQHCSCTSYTMNPFITTSNTFNPNGTRPTITSFRNSRSCLDVGGGGTPPGQAGSPNPGNGSGNVSANANLAWGSGSGATSYDVYFGTDPTPDGGEFQGNVTSTNFALGTLDFSTTYFWRIDSVNTDGTTTGNTWSFTTEVDPGGGGDTVIFADNFDSGASSQWSSTGTVRTRVNSAFAGARGGRLRRTQDLRVTVDASGFTGLRLESARRTRNLDGNERLEVLVNGVLFQTLNGTTGWSTSDINLDQFAGSSAVTVRFSLIANRNNERADIDEVRIIGTN